jgi:uncharacterized protein
VPQTRHTPVRTCVACRQAEGKRTLIRLVRSPQGEVLVDATGRAHGRGAYLHPVAACIEAARKRKALERSLRAPVPDAVWAGLAALTEGEERTHE